MLHRFTTFRYRHCTSAGPFTYTRCLKKRAIFGALQLSYAELLRCQLSSRNFLSKWMNFTEPVKHATKRLER